MGAGQSAEGPGPTRQAAQEVKTSYYELLEVDKQATDDEIKKAYRRRALLLHPDRNYGDVERTTALFAAVQSAYEVLSDPQERAWYDAHEDAILRDIDPTASPSSTTNGSGATSTYEHSVGLTTAADITRLIHRFHSSGIEFTDSPNGFYGYLRDFFAQLAKEEVTAALRTNASNSASDPPDYPSFGHASDTYDAVARPFYAVWTGFSTRKSFAWRDRYRAADAEDRRMRRAIEKENASCRREGVQEFNDAVRALVAFVRRRDPRYQAGADTRSEAERQKVLRDAAQAQAARMRRRNEEEMLRKGGDGGAVPEWARARAREGDSVADDEGDGENGGAVEGKLGESSSSEEEHFECMACRKTFKSERQFEAHERSKKHIKAVQGLRRKLEKEGHVFGVDDGDEREDEGVEQDGDVVEKPAEPPDDDHDDDTISSTTEAQHQRHDDTIIQNDNDETENESSPYSPNRVCSPTNSPPDTTEPPTTTTNGTNGTTPPTQKANSSPPPSSQSSPSSLTTPTSHLNLSSSPPSPPPQQQQQQQQQAPSSQPQPSPPPNPNPPPAASAASAAPPLAPAAPAPKGAAAQKRAKRAAKAATTTTTTSTNGGDDDANVGEKHRCTVCDAGFASRTRLFRHVAAEGHARAPQSAGGGGGGGGSGGGKKGRRKDR